MIVLVVLITFFAVFNMLCAITNYKKALWVGVVFYWGAISIYWINQLAGVI